MTSLRIHHIGPIEEVCVELNKVNVFIGPQSSGKSTINKVACFCTWVEKQVALDQSFDHFLQDGVFIQRLVAFHKMDGYFSPDSEIEYQSEVVWFSFRYSDRLPKFKWMNQFAYVRTKISYIPAERNIVSMISDWKQVNLPNNNIFNFMSDWNVARKKYTPENGLDISYLNAQYYYDEREDMDYLKVGENCKIRLIDASSGQQSLTPLYVLLKYFLQSVYEKEEVENIQNKDRQMKLFNLFFLKSIADAKEREDWQGMDEDAVKNLIESLVDIDEQREEKVQISTDGMKFAKSLGGYMNHYFTTNYSSLFIEEPELNLFPSTQKEVVYYVLTELKKKEHRLFITTHSPYILYAMNNCMIGGQVQDHLPEEVKASFKSKDAWIDPSQVSAWQIRDGKIESIQDKVVKGIDKHYFNDVMGDIMDEYYVLLNYLKVNLIQFILNAEPQTHKIL